MAAKRIGVWISLALAIALLSAWLGLVVGRGLATAWYHGYRQYPANFPTAERRRLEAELYDLRIAESMYALTVVRGFSQQQGRPIPPLQLRALEEVRQKAKTDEMRSVIDLQSAVACAAQAIAEDQNHNAAQSAAYMQAADSLARSLGWPDGAEETLKLVAASQVALTHVPSTESK